MNTPRTFTYAVALLFSGIILLPIFHNFFSPFLGETTENLSQYTDIFNPRQLNLALNSIIMATGTAFFSLIIGVPFAFLCFRTDIKGKNIFDWIYIIPVLIPPYIHAIVWTHMSQFLEDYFFFNIHSLPGAVLVLTFAYFPFVVLTTLTGLRSIDRNLEEASLINHGRIYTLWRITLPLTMPHVLSGGIFIFIFSIINISVPDILRIKVYPMEIFIQFSAYYDEAAATLLSLPLICITILIIALQKIYMKERSYIQISGGRKKPVFFKLKKFHTIAFLFCLAVITLTSLFPIAILIKTAGPFKNYVKALNTSMGEIGYSLAIAFSGSIITMLMGFSIAYLVQRTKSKVSTILSWAVFIPFAIPATAVGIGLIGIWNRAYLDIVYDSSLIIIFGYLIRFIPFAAIIFLSGLEQIGRQLEEAAVLAGGSFFKILRIIVLPLLKQNIFAVLFIVFILSFGELGTTLLIIPPGKETIPIKIYNLMHYGADQLVAALCLILIGIIFAISVIFLSFYQKLTDSWQKTA